MLCSTRHDTHTAVTPALPFESSKKLGRMESLDSRDIRKNSVNDVNGDLLRAQYTYIIFQNSTPHNVGISNIYDKQPKKVSDLSWIFTHKSSLTSFTEFSVSRIQRFHSARLHARFISSAAWCSWCDDVGGVGVTQHLLDHNQNVEQFYIYLLFQAKVGDQICRFVSHCAPT